MYSSDGASAHFKNNISILNLAYHKIDFGLDAAWTCSPTGHGKGAGDGVCEGEGESGVGEGDGEVRMRVRVRGVDEGEGEGEGERCG